MPPPAGRRTDGPEPTTRFYPKNDAVAAIIRLQLTKISNEMDNRPCLLSFCRKTD